MVANGGDLKRWLAKLDNNNAQKEYYITDIIALAHTKKVVKSKLLTLLVIAKWKGLITALQLAALERIYQTEQAERLLLEG